ncbi:MAG: YggW family oxidoreductase, partial [Candidatus Muproteobacteria bacterium RBG_16_62_13]
MPIPLSLYVHLPWCVRKCPYCDFNSHVARGELPEDRYIDVLLRDLAWEVPRIGDRPIDTMFLGGGTPSLFSPESIARLIDGIRERTNLGADAEITLEANPGTVDQARFRGYRDAGVNRLSIGIQSFNDSHLKALGRIHGRDEALAAAGAARAAGFDNSADGNEARAARQGWRGGGFNLDLMFGLPGQGIDDAVADIDAALSFAPVHLSTYQLTLEPNTLFHAQPPALPDDDTIALMQEAVAERLTGAGFVHYEVSAWAKPGHECRHNLNYWQFGDYLGIGAGAHGKLTNETLVTRRWKIKHPDRYLATAGTAAAVGGEDRPAGCELAFEFLLNTLRLTEGFTETLFRERTGLDPGIIRERL